MKKILFSLLLCFTALLFYSKVSAQTLDFSDFKMTPDIVKTATLNNGLKASFCQVDLGITGKELLASDVHDENFKLPGNIKGSPCKGNPEDIIFAMVNVEFTKPVQEQNSVGLFFVLFRDHLFQQNGHPTVYGSSYYPNTPQTFSYNFLNGGEEGNTPPYGNPKWLKYEKEGDFLEMDPSSKEGFKTNPDSGFILYFDSEGNRKEFLFVFEGKIFKLVKAEKKVYNTVVLDYSQKTPQDTGSSANTTTTPNNPAPTTPAPTSTSTTPTTHTTPPTKPLDVIIISSDMTYGGYPNQSIRFNITMPRAGGDISGNFSGLCNGNINGRYDGGEGGPIYGRAWGSCNIPFLDHQVDISYEGSIWPKDGKANIDWLSHSGVTGKNHGSFTQNFIPQSNVQSNTPDSLDKISVNNPTDHKMRLERSKDRIQLIEEYRPKGQVYDFPVLSIESWDSSKKPLPTNAEPVGIVIGGKQGKQYKYGYRGEIYIENPPIVIEYIKNSGQAYFTEEEFQDLLNNIKID